MKRRNIRKWGNSTVVMFTPTDVKDLGIEVGGEVDIENIIVLKKKKRGDGKNN